MVGVTNLTRKRWLVLLACCAVNLSVGSVYAWSVFAGPFAARIGAAAGQVLTAGDLAIVFTLCTAVAPISMTFGGRLNDKFGSRWIIFASGILFGGSMILSAFVSSLPVLMVTYGVLVGLSGSNAYGCTIGTCVKFFPDKRGLIGGLTVSTYGLGSVIVPLIADPLIQTYGVITAVSALGAVFLVLICAAALLLVKCPDGFTPDGWTPPASAEAAPAAKDRDWRGMLSDPVFYVMLFMLVCGAFSGLMVISQASPAAVSLAGLTTRSAALAVSTLALLNTAGRVLAGYVSDKIGRVNCLTGIFLLSLAGLGLLYITTPAAPALLYIGLGITGICFGSFMGVFPGFTADRFGAKHNSVNYGIMFVGFALAGIFGPIMMRNIYASGGSYHPAFLAAAGLTIAGLVSTVLFRVMTRHPGRNIHK